MDISRDNDDDENNNVSERRLLGHKRTRNNGSSAVSNNNNNNQSNRLLSKRKDSNVSNFSLPTHHRIDQDERKPDQQQQHQQDAAAAASTVQRILSRLWSKMKSSRGKWWNVSCSNTTTLMDRTTVLLCAARFTSAVARLCLGPLMPLLATSLHLTDDDKVSLLSAYSSGYILTQLFGGILADRYGHSKVLFVTLSLSSIILWKLATTFDDESLQQHKSHNTAEVDIDSSSTWSRGYFLLGFVAGPLFPAGSAAITHNVPISRRATSFALVDSFASAGTTIASLSPLLVTIWSAPLSYVFKATALSLLLVAIGIANQSPSHDVVHHHSSSSSSPSTTTTTLKMNNNSPSTTHPVSSFESTGTLSTVCSSTSTQSLSSQKHQNGRPPCPSSSIEFYDQGSNRTSNTNQKSTMRSSSSSSSSSVTAVFQPISVFAYLCHCADNFTKYSINAYAATMFVEEYGATPTVVGSILATQEAVGVIAKLAVGMIVTGGVSSEIGATSAVGITKSQSKKQQQQSSSSNIWNWHVTSFSQRGRISCLAFVIQAIALWFAFGGGETWLSLVLSPNNESRVMIHSGIFFILSSVAAGLHSVGFRPIYLEASPDHAGAVSGFGNTVASCASILGPLLIGSATTSWETVGLWMVGVNMVGSVSSIGISYGSMSSSLVCRSSRPTKRTVMVSHNPLHEVHQHKQ